MWQYLKFDFKFPLTDKNKRQFYLLVKFKVFNETQIKGDFIFYWSSSNYLHQFNVCFVKIKIFNLQEFAIKYLSKLSVMCNRR